jgi:hypothetical protein
MNAALAIVAALAVVGAARALLDALPLARRRRGPRADAASADAADLARVGRAVASGTASAADLHLRLRPILRDIATDGLHRHGVELDAEPARAQQLLAPVTWEIVRPDRPAPRDAFARGLPADQLDLVIDDLEALLS